MTGVKSLLKNFQEKEGPTVSFGDDSKGYTKGHGTLSNGNVSFSDVSYVEGLKHNLLSVSQICSLKNKILFDEFAGTILNKEGKPVLAAKRKRNVYTINMAEAKSLKGLCLYSRSVAEKNWLWHKRLSHLNFKTINKLAKDELVYGLPTMSYSKDRLCSACEKGKHHKSTFKSKQFSSISEVFQLLHMDLFGPVSIASLGGKRYALVIVDELSRYTWVFFLKNKSEAASEIINFVKRMETLNGKLIRMIRSDNGTEFRNATLESFCEEKGISQNFSAPRTPQQNGIAERRNRTLVEAARSMLAEAGLKGYFWAEAVNTACFTQNKSIIVKRHNKTAYEILR